MGKVIVFLLALLSCFALAQNSLPAQTVLGIIEWDGPCGRGENGNQGILITSFQVRVRVEGLPGRPATLNLKPILIPSPPEDPQGCGHYELDLRDYYPDVFPVVIGDEGPVVNVQVRSIGVEGLASQPAGCFMDRNCGCSQAVLRGDANNDQVVDISDAVCLLSFLFAAECDRICGNGADFNEDFKIDIADPISLLAELFL